MAVLCFKSSMRVRLAGWLLVSRADNGNDVLGMVVLRKK